MFGGEEGGWGFIFDLGVERGDFSGWVQLGSMRQTGMGRSIAVILAITDRGCLRTRKRLQRTAISKSTSFSANVLISLLKQNLYSPASFAVKTESSCRSLLFSIMVLPLGPVTV